MQASQIPTKFPIPFANGAGGAFIRPIPQASQIGVQAGAASLTDGFPPVTFTPIAAGGTPPFGQDFNGLLNQITAWSQWQNAGGLVPYDAVFSAAIGGYPQGAMLAGAAPGVVWLSVVDNNVTDPDTGGAGWTGLAASAVGGVLTGSLPNPGLANNVVTNAKLAQMAAFTLKGNNTNAAANPGDLTGAQARVMVGLTLRGALFGLTLSNDVSTPASVLDIAAGEAASDATSPTLMVLGSAFTKSIASTWSAGTGHGGLDTGTVANGSYHVFLIAKADGSGVDVLFSASATAPTMPATYTLKRRIGSLKYASGISAFVQDGDNFYWNTASPPSEFNSGSARAKSALTLSGVPSGIRVEGVFETVVTINNNGAGVMALYDGANPLIAKTVQASLTSAAGSTGSTNIRQFTNTSAQIQMSLTGNLFGACTLDTLGWIDTRGR